MRKGSGAAAVVFKVPCSPWTVSLSPPTLCQIFLVCSQFTVRDTLTASSRVVFCSQILLFRHLWGKRTVPQASGSVRLGSDEGPRSTPTGFRSVRGATDHDPGLSSSFGGWAPEGAGVDTSVVVRRASRLPFNLPLPQSWPGPFRPAAVRVTQENKPGEAGPGTSPTSSRSRCGPGR